jgi:hypothetical protein
MDQRVRSCEDSPLRSGTIRILANADTNGQPSLADAPIVREWHAGGVRRARWGNSASEPRVRTFDARD